AVTGADGDDMGLHSVALGESPPQLLDPVGAGRAQRHLHQPALPGAVEQTGDRRTGPGQVRADRLQGPSVAVVQATSVVGGIEAWIASHAASVAGLCTRLA